MTRRSASSRRTAFALATLCATAYALLTAAPALALETHVFSTSFTGSGTNALSNPTDIAVDNSSGTSQHDIYVTDPANHRVEKFDSSGNFILMFGQGVNSGTGNPNVCTAAGPPTDVCQPGTPGSSPGAFETPTFIAVDGSSGPSAGDVYVGDTVDSLVSKFDSSGNLIASWGSGGQLNGFGSLAGIAVDPSGNLYVLDDSSAQAFEFSQDDATINQIDTSSRGTTPNGIAVDSSDNLYKVAGTPNVEEYSNTSIDIGEVDHAIDAVGLVVDPSTNDLYVDQGSGVINHFAAGCSLPDCTPADSFGSGHLNGAAGIGVDASSHTVYAANTGSGTIAVFTAVILPDVTTGASSNVDRTTATVAGHVDPAGGGNVSACHFEYVDDANYDPNATDPYSAGPPPIPCSQATPFNSVMDVSANLTNLLPATTYHYRLAAANAGGTITGSDQRFTTMPAVIDLATGPAINITLTPSSATLTGSYTGDGTDTHYYFEYGSTTAYGQTTAAAPGADAGSGTGTENVSALASVLPNNNIYHYRIVATNTLGTTYGSDQTFFSAPPNLPTIDATAASSVTQSAATLEAQVKPGFGATVVRFEYGTTTSYGSKTYPTDSIGSDGVDHPASADISALSPGTTYHFRAIATNVAGTARGPDQTFNTTDLPAVAGTAASDIGQTTATLRAAVRPGFSPTTYHFEYGPTEAYGSSTSESASIGSDNSVHAAAAAISGLTAATTYHFRIVATNTIGTTAGPDQAFTTASTTPILTPPPNTCKQGFVKKKGKCVKRQHHVRKHHKRSASHG
jgi:hypothetical protein